jgi:predicted Zn-dependent protease
LTEAERRSITGVRLRIVTAEAGESVAELGTRTDNRWTPDYTALLNDIRSDETFQGGELVKIAREEPYFGVKE